LLVGAAGGPAQACLVKLTADVLVGAADVPSGTALRVLAAADAGLVLVEAAVAVAASLVVETAEAIADAVLGAADVAEAIESIAAVSTGCAEAVVVAAAGVVLAPLGEVAADGAAGADVLVDAALVVEALLVVEATQGATTALLASEAAFITAIADAIVGAAVSEDAGLGSRARGHLIAGLTAQALATEAGLI
jgi:hypothetical protein